LPFIGRVLPFLAVYFFVFGMAANFDGWPKQY